MSTVRTFGDKALAKKYLDFDCEAVPEAIWNYQAQRGTLLHPGKKILISVNKYATGSENIAQVLTNLNIEKSVYTLSMQDSSDDFYHNIKSAPLERIILPEAVSLHKKAAFLASADLVITSRLHAGLIAISHGVPAVMLKSTPKVAFFMKDLELESLLYKDEINEKMIEDILLDENLKGNLLSVADSMKKRANTDLISE